MAMRPARSRPPGRSTLVAAIIAVSLIASWPVPASADQSLHHARNQLAQTKQAIRERAARLREVQRALNRLATQISLSTSAIGHAQERMQKLERSIAILTARDQRLQDRLAARSRETYILGPGAPILYLLTATSAADAVSRISFLDEMTRRDALLAMKVQRSAERLASARGEQIRTAHAIALAIDRLGEAQRRLRRTLARSHRLYARLQLHKTAVLYAISRIRPFAVCPVQGPHAVADDFGIWVHHSEKEGGDHIHQGNDISAALGTPIVAPFDGVATVASNKIGGLAVKVFGQFGYVYNAHLSRFGTLGTVTKGTVIGYVGETGNASGPHDHFEWHPGGGPAVDPHAFLLQVC
jgi:murein DD-endopeptidase MepM/ murein hydrolase activator NlpD